MTTQTNQPVFKFPGRQTAALLGCFAVFVFSAPISAHAQSNLPPLPGSGDTAQSTQETEFLTPAPGEGFQFSPEPAAPPQQSADEIAESARREAFDAALQGLLPLRPAEIRELLEHFDRTQESVEVPVHPYPKPEVSVETLSLEPGAQPAKVNVAYGHVSTITFLDSTGQPWPIENVTWAGNFQVIDSSSASSGEANNTAPAAAAGDQGSSDKGTHIIRIAPESEFAYGNISINLIKFSTPIILTLETSRDRVHYRFDAIIPKPGPFGNAPLIDTGFSLQAGDNKDITSVLTGVLPKSAKKLTVSGVDGRTTAYKNNGATFLRTPLTLLSPGWTSSMSSADGMNVYEIKNTPVIILSENGQMVRAHLSDREDVINE